MQFTIINRWNNSEIYTGEHASIYNAMRSALGIGKSLCDADLRGADLRGAILRGAILRGADLRDANLCGADLCGAYLCSADLRDANLCGANLCSANLRGADLRGAYLCDADLCGADLCGAYLPFVPKIKNLDARILEAISDTVNHLEMKNWHQCETTHCRGGWAIHLAGEAGKVLESVFGASAAATLIYHASTGKIPNFYASKDEALADIKACAATQKFTK